MVEWKVFCLVDLKAVQLGYELAVQMGVKMADCLVSKMAEQLVVLLE